MRKFHTENFEKFQPVTREKLSDNSSAEKSSNEVRLEGFADQVASRAAATCSNPEVETEKFLNR